MLKGRMMMEVVVELTKHDRTGLLWRGWVDDREAVSEWKRKHGSIAEVEGEEGRIGDMLDEVEENGCDCRLLLFVLDLVRIGSMELVEGTLRWDRPADERVLNG
jgi:hypothetical protein